MQQIRYIEYYKKICPYCGTLFEYPDFRNPPPPTCYKLECLKKHYFKGIESLANSNIALTAK